MRVVVAEDVMLMREGIVHLLREAGVDIVGEAADGDALLRLTRGHRPDVVVVDILRPSPHTDEGLVAAEQIGRELPGTGVVVLSHYVEASYAMELIEQHPEGVRYLLKDRVLDASVLVDAIRRVHEGETVVDPTIVARLLGRQRRHDPLAALTPRAREVLGLVAEGYSNGAIAERLTITLRTVEIPHVPDLPKAGPGRHARPTPASAGGPCAAARLTAPGLRAHDPVNQNGSA